MKWTVEINCPNTTANKVHVMLEPVVNPDLEVRSSRRVRSVALYYSTILDLWIRICHWIGPCLLSLFHMVALESGIIIIIIIIFYYTF